MARQLIKNLLSLAGIDLTQNQRYDRQTLHIMKKVIKPGANCVDVGCHKGELFDIILKLSPNGHHYAFEPLPLLYEALLKKYKGRNCDVYPYALDKETGITTFNYVVNAPAYSGLQIRTYSVLHPKIEKIKVAREKLDNIIPIGTKIDFMKIDVEGGEFNVLQGAEQTIKNSQPVIIFEFGQGASEFYGTTSEALYHYITNTLGLRISILKDWLENKKALDMEEFDKQYQHRLNYYFVAHP